MNLVTTLATQANQHHELAQEKAREAVQHALAAGRALAEAKSQVGHGKWSQWLTDNFNGSARHARRYVMLAQRLEALPESKRTRVANLPSLRQALEAVADEEKPRKVNSGRVEPLEVPAWLPRSTRTVATWHARLPLNGEDVPACVKVQRHADEPDYWCLFALNDNGECAFTRRGIRGSHVPFMFELDGFKEVLPDPGAADWQYEDIGPNFVKRVLIDTIQS